MLQIDFVSLQKLIWILGSPPEQYPNQMIFNHRNHGMRNISLFLRQRCIQILFEFGAQFVDNDCRVSDLFAIQFDEWKLSLFGSEFKFMVDILNGKKENSFCKLFHDRKQFRLLTISQINWNNKKPVVR